MNNAIAICSNGFSSNCSISSNNRNKRSTIIITINKYQTELTLPTKKTTTYVIESPQHAYNKNCDIPDGYILSNSENLLDVNKIYNLSKIDKMASLKKNWNGYGGKCFKRKALQKFRSIIDSLDIQPEIAPTGRGSLYIQFENNTSSLSFEVFENSADKVLVPNGDFSKLQSEHITEDLEQSIKRAVDKFYGRTRD